jgi:hypothetical protein
MKRITMIVMAVALMVSFAGIAAAQPGARDLDRRGTQRIERREWRQHQRIQRGIASGQLTRGETIRLRQGQRHIRHMELRARADGRVGPRERVRMHRALDRQSARIWRLKHNGRSI